MTLAKQLSVNQLKKDPHNLGVGKSLAQEELDFFREEQLAQLYELMQEAKSPKFVPEEGAQK